MKENKVFFLHLEVTICTKRAETPQEHQGGRGKMIHLRAVIVCGAVVECRNYLFVLELGSVVPNRIHKLQKVGRGICF